MLPDDGPGSSVHDLVIAMIVKHALDDLEAQHVDLPTVLTLTALAGWRESDRAAGRPCRTLSSPDSPRSAEPPSPRDAP
ncbi:MAG: hypothetical protein H0V92_01570 [Pseudonocardiales bacterium]|nr:hypothetical protein [Pseudonocardiales bacterium]